MASARASELGWVLELVAGSDVELAATVMGLGWVSRLAPAMGLQTVPETVPASN
jgi:hypothetical protein